MKRIAKEILKVVEKPDIVLVCCGGGTLLAGIAAGLSFLGSSASVYGIEPVTGIEHHFILLNLIQ